MDQDKTIVFMEFTNSGEASIVKGALESNNIPCFLSNENNPYVGSILSDSFYGVRLHIFEKDKDKATELMNLIHSAREDEDESLWSEMDLDEVSD
jgi:hypothetical protein